MTPFSSTMTVDLLEVTTHMGSDLANQHTKERKDINNKYPGSQF